MIATVSTTATRPEVAGGRRFTPRPERGDSLVYDRETHAYFWADTGRPLPWTPWTRSERADEAAQRARERAAAIRRRNAR